MHEILKSVAPDFINNIRELNKRELDQFIKELNQFIADKERLDKEEKQNDSN